MRRPVRLLGIALIAAVSADVLIARAFLADGAFLGRRVAPFDPPLFAQFQFERLAQLEERALSDPEGFYASTELDAEIGWCPRAGSVRGVLRYDERGARTADESASSLATSTDQQALVALVGCSFTRGDEVEVEETWAARVDALPSLEAANFGVGGHGLDQTLLRYRRDVRPLAPGEVWVGFLPTALLRITTHFPPLFNHWSHQLTFKPRFRLHVNDELELVPNPAPNATDMFRLLRDQKALLAAIGESDFWIRRAPWAYVPRQGALWSWSATAQLVATWREGREHASLLWFDRPDSEPYRLLRALVLQFDAEVTADGGRLRLLILPSRRGLWAAGGASAPWTGWTDEIEAAGIDVLDLTSAMNAVHLAPRDEGWMPNGHYSPMAHGIVFDAIRQAGWLELASD